MAKSKLTHREHTKNELTLNNISFDTPKWINQDDLLEHLNCLLNAHVHEGRRFPSGVLFCDKPPSIDDIQFMSIADVALARSMANGLNSFVLWTKDGFHGLAVLRAPVHSQKQYIELSNKLNAILLIRDSRGACQIINKETITECIDRSWTFKPAIHNAVETIRNHAYSINVALLRHFLNFAYYVLSPSKIGATLVWLLNDAAVDEFHMQQQTRDIKPVNLTEIGLSVADDRHTQIISHYLSQIDGASIFTPSGNLCHAKIQLQYSPKARALIEEHGGTRHTSAKRFSFDEERCICVVVSEDGPITVFSDGLSVASISAYDAGNYAEHLKKLVPANADGVWSSGINVTCDKCGKAVDVSIVTVAGMRDRETADCPLCGNEVHSANCFRIDARITKRI